MFKRTIPLFILFSLLLPVAETQAYKWYWNPYEPLKMIGGITGTYNLQNAPTNLTTWWGDSLNVYMLFNDALYLWNNRSEAQFTKTTTSPAKINGFGADYGYTGWAGMTNWYFSDGTRANPDGMVPSYNWNYANVALNASHLLDYSRDQQLAITEHELGHAMGLAHYNETPAVMNTGSDPKWNIQSDDVNGINNLY